MLNKKYFLSVFLFLFLALVNAELAYDNPNLPRITSPIAPTTGSSTIVSSNSTTICVYQSEYIVYDEAGAPPAGFFPYGNAVTVIARGYPVLYNMEITAITFSSTTMVECMGADAVTNNTCKVGIVYNQSGSRINPLNITLNAQLQKTVLTSTNLTNGDQILVQGYGNAVANASSAAISGSIVQFEARTINCTIISNSSSSGGGNSSFNQTLTDTLYAGIEWDYNQTIPAMAYADATFLRIGENATIARAGTSTGSCAAGTIAQNITVVTNTTGIFVTSWQCASISSPSFINVSYINQTEVFTGQKTFNSSAPTKIDGAQLDMDENAINFSRWGVTLNASFFNGTEVGNAFQVISRDGVARFLMYSNGANAQFSQFNGTEFRIGQNANSKFGFYQAISTVNNNRPLELGGFFSALQILSIRANASTTTWDVYTNNDSNTIGLRFKMPVTLTADSAVNANLSAETLKISNSTNDGMNRCTLVSGVCTISNTRVTADTNIFCFEQSQGGTIGSIGISARNAGVNYTVTSSNILDTSIVACLLIDPVAI